MFWGKSLYQESSVCFLLVSGLFLNFYTAPFAEQVLHFDTILNILSPLSRNLGFWGNIPKRDWLVFLPPSPYFSYPHRLAPPSASVPSDIPNPKDFWRGFPHPFNFSRSFCRAAHLYSHPGGAWKETPGKARLSMRKGKPSYDLVHTLISTFLISYGKASLLSLLWIFFCCCCCWLSTEIIPWVCYIIQSRLKRVHVYIFMEVVIVPFGRSYPLMRRCTWFS